MLVLSLFSVALRAHYPGIVVERGITYDEENKLKLDVYYPKKRGNGILYPVLLYVHGGAWISGQRRHTPSYVSYFVSRGGVAVSCSYRLAPKHAFPAHVVDINNAIKWIENNIQGYNGDPSFIFLSGGMNMLLFQIYF